MLDELLRSPIFNWISAAALATVVSIAVTSYWERRKLNRSERTTAYADFLSAFSKRWKAMGDRDGAKKRDDADETARIDVLVDVLRDELYDAYTRIQVLGSQQVVEAALQCVRLSDLRNRSYKMGTPGVAADKRSAALSRFTKVAREDTGLKPLDTFKFGSGKDSIVSKDGYTGDAND